MSQISLQLPTGFISELIASAHVTLRECDSFPSAELLHEVVSTAFWASLIPDEGRFHAFTISLAPRYSDARVLGLAKSIPLRPTELTKFALATASDISAVHVGNGRDGPEIFGIDTLWQTSATLLVEVRAPGKLAVRTVNDVTLGVVARDQAFPVDQSFYSDPLFTRGAPPAAHLNGRLQAITRGLCSHGHGGAILVLSAAEDCSILDIHRGLDKAFDGHISAAKAAATATMKLVQDASANDGPAMLTNLKDHWSILSERYRASIARTTAVDGALVLNHDGEMLGFAAKIGFDPNKEVPRVRKRGIEVNAAWTSDTDTWGTRHQSAARFVSSTKGRAFVASQDGKLSIIYPAAEDVECIEHAEWLI